MSENIKKSLLITLSFPPDLGGEQAFYYNIAKNLPADKIVVIAPEQEGSKEFDQRQDFPIIRKNFNSLKPQTGLDKLFGTIKWMKLSKDIREIVKNHNIDIIHAGQILPIGTAAMMYSQKNNTPYIIYAHGLDILLPQNIKRKKILMQKIIKSAQGIVTNSHFTRDEIIKLGADDEKIVVANPCPNIMSEEASQWSIDDIKKQYELDGKKIILTIGRLVERKGHDMVIKAMPQILKSTPNAKYLVVGDGPYRKKLEQLVNQNNLREHVIFLGKVANKNMPAIFQIADVFAMPNRQLKNGDVEGFGIVFLEAGLFGKPVIGGRNGGVPEAIADEQTGLLVDPENLNDITAKITRLLNDESYAHKLGMQGLERASDFDWKDQVETIKTLLK